MQGYNYMFIYFITNIRRSDGIEYIHYMANNKFLDVPYIQAIYD